MNYKCPLTNSINTDVVYIQKEVPVFQHIVFDDISNAINTKKEKITLVQSNETGFIFNGDYKHSSLDYNENYQNEQSHSTIFQKHLENVIEILNSSEVLNGRILEIGCGKGYFMDMLLKIGKDIIGIDPTYEGDSDKVIKEYYSEKHGYLDANLIILRHTLEHIASPYEFLKMIAESNNYKGYIYIEVPTFDWIVENNSIEDIFYEHCNYFTEKTLSLMFTNSEVHYLFNKQYIGLIAKLSDVKNVIENQIINFKKNELPFEEKLKYYLNILNNNSNIAIWGAGAKGSTFLNLLDPNNEKIKCVIDVNPKKQGRFIGGTGHKIVSPDRIGEYKIDNIIIMNNIYFDEIQEYLYSNNYNIKLITL